MKSKVTFLFIVLYAIFSFIYGQCTKDIECKGDRICIDGKCVSPPEKIQESPCTKDIDCEGDKICIDEKCVDPQEVSKTTKDVTQTENKTKNTPDTKTKPTSFSYEELTADFPTGWKETANKARYNDEIVGIFESENIPGSTILIYYKRERLVKLWVSTLRRIALKVIASTYPGGQKMLKDKTKMESDYDEEIQYELWQGFIQAENLVITFQSPFAIVEIGHHWFIFLGITPDSSGEEFYREFMTIIKSIRERDE